MKLKNLVIFRAVCEEMSMTKAANIFGISQSSVSQIIKDIEQHYNIPLFIRVKNKIHLTEGGIQLLKYTNKLMLVHDEMEEVLESFREDKVLRIGVSGPGIVSSIQEKLQKILLKYPDCNIEVKYVLINKELTMLTKGNIDILVTLDATNYEGITSQKIGHIEESDFKNYNPISKLKIINSNTVYQIYLKFPSTSMKIKEIEKVVNAFL